MNTKYKIAKIIAAGYYYSENPTYEQLLESIYNNHYKTILKVPTNVFLLGTIESFIIKNIDHANRILNMTKEVVKEALEMSGLELTYTDSDWDNLNIIENDSKWGSKYLLSICSNDKQTLTKKGYMSSFFEDVS